MDLGHQHQLRLRRMDRIDSHQPGDAAMGNRSGATEITFRALDLREIRST